jgi:hypothetical protein
MATSPERTFAQELNTWVQTIGIIIAALWGAYTFIYKEVMLPRSAPVNITVDLQLKKIGTATSQAQDEKTPLIPVEMRISATNPSPREVYLLPTAWIAYGAKVNISRGSGAFATQAASVLNSSNGFYVEKHAASVGSSVVAIGSLLKDSVLKPHETATRTIVFHVPPGIYDLLDVQAIIPTLAKKGGAALEWKFDKDNGLVPVVYRVGASGERKEMEKTRDGEYSDTHLELQSATSMAILSLRQ